MRMVNIPHAPDRDADDQHRGNRDPRRAPHADDERGAQGIALARSGWRFGGDHHAAQRIIDPPLCFDLGRELRLARQLLFKSAQLGSGQQAVEIEIEVGGLLPAFVHGAGFSCAGSVAMLGYRSERRSRRCWRARCTCDMAVPSGIWRTLDISEYSICSIVRSNKQARAISETELSALVT